MKYLLQFTGVKLLSLYFLPTSPWIAGNLTLIQLHVLNNRSHKSCIFFNIYIYFHTYGIMFSIFFNSFRHWATWLVPFKEIIVFLFSVTFARSPVNYPREPSVGLLSSHVSNQLQFWHFNSSLHVGNFSFFCFFFLSFILCWRNPVPETNTWRVVRVVNYKRPPF